MLFSLEISKFRYRYLNFRNPSIAPSRYHQFENQYKRKEQFALAQGTLEALKEELHERTEHLAQLKIKVILVLTIFLFEFIL